MPSLADSKSLWISRDGQVNALKVQGAVAVADLVAAERKLLGPGFSIRVFEGSRLMPSHAFLHPCSDAQPYKVVVQEKKARKQGNVSTFQVPSASAKPLLLPTHGASDVAIWCGLLRLQAACSTTKAFIVPPGLAQTLLDHALAGTEVQAPFEWPHSCDVCLVPLLHQGHWTLLALHPSETGGLQAECWESIPGRNVAVAHALAELLCAFCRAQLVSFSESCHQVQVEAASCGAYLLAHAGQVLFGEGACFDGLLADSRAFLRHIPPHTACRWGTGGLSDAQVSELQKILCDRGVPDTVVGERVRAAVDKIGAGSIAKALQASNVWQALKSAGSAPASLFRWVLPEELKAHAQAKASKSFGTAVPNAKARKQKPSKGPKPVLHVDPCALLLAQDSFATKEGAPLPQLGFNEVGPQAQGVAFCSAAQFIPFLQDYRPLSVAALAIISTAPIPPEVIGGAPVTHLRFPAVYAPTQEAVLISGSLLQLGDDHVQLKPADSAMEDIEQPDTLVGRLSLYRDESNIPWEEVVQAPVRALLKHVPGLQLCHDPSCKGDCACFHQAVEECVDQLLLDLWSRSFCKTDGGRVHAAQAEMFQVLIRVPSSACRHLQRLASAGVYFEPRAGDGSGILLAR